MVMTTVNPDNSSIIKNYSTVTTVTRTVEHINFNYHYTGPRLSSCRLDTNSKKTIWISNKLRNKRIKMGTELTGM